MTDSPKPIQPIRNDAVMLSYEAKKALNIIAKAQGLSCTDELAQSVVMAWLGSTFPDVLEHIREQSAKHDKFRKELKAKINPTPFASE